jgi:hypothetical protein
VITFFLSALPLWQSGLLVVVVPTLLAMIGPAMVRRSYGLEKLVTNNEVAGFKFAVLGVIYAVLQGFAVLVVWEQFAAGGDAVTREAGAAAILYRLADEMPEPARGTIRADVTHYLRSAIAEDWPAMSRGRLASGPSSALTRIYHDVIAVAPPEPHQTALLGEVFRQLDQMTDARRQRLSVAAGATPNVIWLALVVGAVVTVGFTFFFATQSLRVQVAMTALLAVLVFMVLLVLVSIDHPFTGPVSVGTEPLDIVLGELGG